MQFNDQGLRELPNSLLFNEKVPTTNLIATEIDEKSFPLPSVVDSLESEYFLGPALLIPSCLAYRIFGAIWDLKHDI
ncbi:hypothetical protein P8452_26618 [Trifolium repens]|nr:hypothetical protein P8452_26618 [Trifolium repens]